MLLCNDIAIKILFSILFLSSTGNDNKSMNSEHGFVSSFATNNNIVSDVNQGQSKLQKSIADSFAEGCPILYLNTLKQCFPSLEKNNSSFELYNLTDQTKKRNLTAERENLRLFAETSSNNNQTIGFKALAFFKESLNYIYSLKESQKLFIVLSYLCAILKYYGVGLRTIISKVRSKLFGKPTRVKAPTRKISLLEGVDTDLPTTPSEKTILVQNDIARDGHVNTDQDTTDSSCDEHVNTDEETTDSSCGSHVDTDEDSITTSSSVENLPTNTQTIPPTSIPTQLKHSPSFDSLSDESCDEDFPDEFFVFPSDSGNIGMMLGPDEWEKIETENSCQEILTSDEGGTSSAGIESGQCYDVVSDADGRASSHSYCHSPVPKEMVSCLSSGSVGNPLMVISDTTTSDCDEGMEESDQEMINYDCDVDQRILECGDSDSYNHTSPYTVNFGDEHTNNNLAYHCDLISEDDFPSDLDYSFDYYEGECSKHGSTLQRSDSESDISIEVYNNIERENLRAGNINRWLSNDMENEIVQENIVDMSLEQRVRNHAVAAAIFAGTFVLPCFIAAKLLK